MLVLLLIGLAVALSVEILRPGLSRRRRAVSVGGLALALIVVLALLPGSFGLQKLVGRLLMPAGLLWLVILWAALSDLRAGRFRRGALETGIFVVYAAVGNVYLGHWLLQGLEAEVEVAAPRQSTIEDGFDAVFILGGGTKLGPKGDPQLANAGDRVRRAAALYHEGRTAILVASGRSPPPFGLGDLSLHTQELLEEMGVPSAAVLRLSKPVNTTEEIAAYAELAGRRGWKKTGLISSAWHLPRALELARKKGLSVVPLPADHLSGPTPPSGAVWLVPQSLGFALVQTWAWERLGRAVGR